MSNLRYRFALFCGKATYQLMKLLGRNASYFPGALAIKLCPDFLAHLKTPETVIAVTGTNGKTTTSNMLTAMLRDCGYKVTNNALGSNVQAGVVSALIADTTFSGKPTTDVAVLEVDERSSLRVYPQLKPDYVLCNNLMRDSIRRNAHAAFIQYIISTAIPKGTKLILDGDDLLCCGIAPENPRVYFGVEAEKPEKLVIPAVRDVVYCPKCGGELVPEYIRYNHIGRYTCKDCGYASPALDYAVTAMDHEKNTFTLRHGQEEDTFRMVNDNIVNVYNSCGICALLFEMGLSREQIEKAFSGLSIIKSRYSVEEAGDLRITIQSAKGQNALSCVRAFDYAASCPGENKSLVMFITERYPDPDANSEHICWIYDTDFSALCDPSIRQVIFCQPQGMDLKLRALLNGVPEEKIQLSEGLECPIDLVDTEHCKDIYIFCDVYLVKPAEELRDALKKKAQEGKA